MELDKETVWSTNVNDAAHDFAEAVRRLCDEIQVNLTIR